MASERSEAAVLGRHDSSAAHEFVTGRANDERSDIPSRLESAVWTDERRKVERRWRQLPRGWPLDSVAARLSPSRCTCEGTVPSCNNAFSAGVDVTECELFGLPLSPEDHHERTTGDGATEAQFSNFRAFRFPVKHPPAGRACDRATAVCRNTQLATATQTRRNCRRVSTHAAPPELLVTSTCEPAGWSSNRPSTTKASGRQAKVRVG